MPVSLAAAFVAGLFSFVSPCVLPIVPGYLSFISGVNVSQFKEGSAPGELVRRVALASLAFVLGFSTVFVALGAAATLIGALLQEHKRTLGMIGGIVIIVLGLHTMGVFKIQWLLGEKRAQAPAKPLGLVGAYVVGLAFAFGWTPCIGPVLGAILALAAQGGSAERGLALMAAYAVGLGLPFLLTALFLGRALALMAGLRRHMPAIERAMGILLVGVGLMMLTGAFSDLSFWLLETFPALGRIG
jgi:cytochrome c-type biogenesis protein